MGVKDPHDPREFRHFAQCDAAGNILALVEVADSAPEPVGSADAIHVDVSALGRVDLTGVATKAVIKQRALAQVAQADLKKEPAGG